jgi:hypothetical protein
MFFEPKNVLVLALYIESATSKGGLTCPGCGVCANKSVTKWGKTATVEIIKKDRGNDNFVILIKQVLE